MKKLSVLVSLVCLCLLHHSTQAQISGTVFKDFNFNGVKESTAAFKEPGVFGVVVNVYNAGNNLAGTATTDTLGAYSIPLAAGLAVRIEFIAPAGSVDGKSGAGNGSAVQFATAPSAVNYAISSTKWYSASQNPYVATNAASNGDPAAATAGTAATTNNLHIFPYNMGAGTPDSGGTTRRLPNSQLGSVFGMAYQKTTRTLFMAAYLKRHAGFGPGGIGAIYKSVVGVNGVPAAATLLTNVTTLGIDVGTSPRTGGTGALTNNSTDRNADPGVFAEVGKRGIGGMDMSEDGRSLYFVNMAQNKLHRINVGNPVKASITSSDVTGTWLLPVTSAPFFFHPMACKVANGKVYVGGVIVREKTTAHNLNADTVGMRGIVYQFDTATAAFTEVLRFPISYRRGHANQDFRYPFKMNWWCAWQNNGSGDPAAPIRSDYNTAAGTFNGGVYYPQPMLAGIEFDVDGSMVIGLRDRFGDQMGYQNLSDDNLPVAGGFSGQYFRGLCSGEILRAGKNIGVDQFTMESVGKVLNNGHLSETDSLDTNNPDAVGNWGNGTTASSGTPWAGAFGPGWGGTATTIPPNGPNPGTKGGYFYFNENYSETGTPATLNYSGAIASHYNKSNGTVALLAGSGEVLHTAMDPAATSYEEGVIAMSNTTGNMTQRLKLTTTVTANLDPTNMGKAGGMCDLEILTDYQPVEVGNRIWNDSNNNGIQDAGEGGINGVIVQLTGPGTDGLLGTADDVVLASTTTGTSGEFNFNALTTADSRRPASFIGLNANTILPGFDYQIRILTTQASLSGYRLSRTNAGSNGFDNIDNDATLINGYWAINFNVTGNDHSFDIGLRTSAVLGDRVWLDNGTGGGTANDGIQNGSEPGVANVPVSLYTNGINGITGDDDDVLSGSVITDAFGNYTFNNLIPGVYNIRVTAPANYVFTTQTNTTDDNGAGGTSATGSDVNFFGTSYSITLSNGEVYTNIDAGLSFKTVTASGSIGDLVWLDNNGDGVRDAGEPGISGVTVTLYDNSGNILMITKTDANGSYVFNNLPVGTYVVGVTPVGGTVLSPFTGTTPANGTANSDIDPVTRTTTAISIATAGTVITGIDAGLKLDTKAAIGDFVWNDINQNGIQETGEPGIPGVTLELYTAGVNGLPGGGDDILVTSTKTDINGYYLFNGLVPATYFIVATPITNYTSSPKDVANIGGDTKDSDFGANASYPGKYTSPIKTVSSSGLGQTRDLTIDLGLYTTVSTNNNSLGDLVFNDQNKNGLFDAGEPGVSNVTVRLLNGSGAVVNNPATGKPYVVSTDTSGLYKFVNLADGNYIPEFVNLPPAFSFTKQDAAGTGAPGSGTDVDTDSDVNPATGRTAAAGVDPTSATAAAVNISSVDAGVKQGIDAGTASIGNRVWFDRNGNNLQDAGETGVPNVKVELLDGSGSSIDTDAGTAGVQPYILYTNGIGEYLFTGLGSGSYRVKISSLPSGYTSPSANIGTNDDTDADAAFTPSPSTTASTATTATYNLQAGEDNMSIDFGLIPSTVTNRLGDFVWNDLNGNGLQDAGEPGIRGVNVTLFTNGADGIPASSDDVLVNVMTTDSTGKYAFFNLADGSYNVGFSNLPAGFSFAAKDATGFTAANGSDANILSGRTGTVSLDAGGTSPTSITDNNNDAGLITTRATLGNYVWSDVNADGVQDATEAGIAGTTVTLYGSDAATVLASAVTDASGLYNFGNLPTGSYVVGFGTTPGGVSFTVQNTPGDNGVINNSDANPATGKSAVIVLSASEIDNTVDAGLRPDLFASVGDYVWNDANNNGKADPAEQGMSGILVTLYNSGNAIVGSAITDGNGKYLISRVPAGSNYYIIFSNKPGTSIFTTRTDNVTAIDNSLGSDPDPSNGRTSNFSLAAGQYLPNVDAGLQSVTVVAVQLLNFTALKQAENVKLNWSAENQQTADHYDVEHSTDNRTFTKIGTVAASGSYSGSYQMIHNSPARGSNYYRIVTIDRNGADKYSDIRKVSFDKNSDVLIYPNPATAVVTVSISGNAINKPATMILYSAEGKTISITAYASLSNRQIIDVSKLASGNYVLKIFTADEVLSEQIKVVR